jgi:hypothetical protein
VIQVAVNGKRLRPDKLLDKLNILLEKMVLEE